MHALQSHAFETPNPSGLTPSPQLEASHSYDCNVQEQESRLRSLGGKEMLTQLPILQHLMQRLVDCKPSGQATHDPVVQVALPLPLAFPHSICFLTVLVPESHEQISNGIIPAGAHMLRQLQEAFILCQAAC